MPNISAEEQARIKAYWAKRQAEEEARYLREFDTDAHVDENGVVRWNSTNRVPPGEILEVWRKHNKPFNFVLSVESSKVETAKAIIEYRKAQAERTPDQVAEQRAMARGAVGPGHELVNVFTGERYTT